MRLVRFSGTKCVNLGALDDGAVVPLDGLADTYPTMLSVVAAGDQALDAIRNEVSRSSTKLSLDSLRLMAPLERPQKYLAIGMNYRKHIEEAKQLGAPAPSNQYWFNKQTSCIAGPFDEIDPGVSEAVDYEVELGVVIGQRAKSVTAQHAKEHVFGYVICNDISARDWQAHSPTFTVGKSFDTHGPIGPWIVTADEIPDPHSLTLRCLVNNEVRQDSNTSELIFNVWDQIEYLSQAFTLEPGDLLATGTPNGVGVAMSPPRFLKPGDVVRCEIERIGAIENRVSTPTRH